LRSVGTTATPVRLVAAGPGLASVVFLGVSAGHWLEVLIFVVALAAVMTMATLLWVRLWRTARDNPDPRIGFWLVALPASFFAYPLLPVVTAACWIWYRRLLASTS